MAAPKIAAVATATPPWRYDQATVLRMSGYDDPRRMGLIKLHADSALASLEYAKAFFAEHLGDRKTNFLRVFDHENSCNKCRAFITV
jgi:hypothetical protein